jgi:CheY-like chemotaxis protein/HPt (histidine-containing phosphotransfer) domain-containing protein
MMNASPELAGRLGEVWERFQGRTQERIAEQEQAIVALLAHALTADHQARVLQEAHKLAGSLGTFGFPEGSRLALDLEQAWAGPLGSTERGVRLAEIVVDLRRATRSPGPAGLQLTPAAAASQPGYDRVDVVLVDDDDALARLVVTAVEDAGHTVRWFPDGAAAIEALGGAEPSVRGRVLLLDVQMPERNGFEVLAELSQARALADTRVVMLTARSHQADVLRAHQLGAFDYIAKPFGIPLLLRRVNRALDTRADLRSAGDLAHVSDRWRSDPTEPPQA